MERKFIYFKLANTEFELYKDHRTIVSDINFRTQQQYTDQSNNNNFNYTDWLNFLHETDVIVYSHANYKKSILNRKFQKLLLKQQPSSKPIVEIVPNYVKNLSSAHFSDPELSLLNKGLNYTPKPSNINMNTAIVEIETAIKYQSDFTKNCIRKEKTNIENG